MTTPDQFLAASRREFSIAKRWKSYQWRIDVAASLGALAAAAVAVPRLSLAIVILAAVAKVGARFAQLRSRSCFRVAERARRYDFQRRALGWEIPHDEYADIVLSFSGKNRSLPAADAERMQVGYFEHEGPPGADRLLANLHESVFWSKRLLADMAKRRGWHVFWALSAVIATMLVGLVVPWDDGRLILVRVVAVTVTILVSLDVFGEWTAFRRSSNELAVIERVLIELRKGRQITKDQALRFLIDYSCLLFDAPMVPDKIYAGLQPQLEQLWAAGRADPGRDRGHVETGPAVTKVVTVRTPNFGDEGLGDLHAALKAIDPEIQLHGTAALSGRPFSEEVLLIAVSGFVGVALRPVADEIVKWALSLLKRRGDVEIVKIVGPDGETLSEVRREKE